LAALAPLTQTIQTHPPQIPNVLAQTWRKHAVDVAKHAIGIAQPEPFAKKPHDACETLGRADLEDALIEMGCGAHGMKANSD
jgi:hypothetical protein